MKLVSTNKNIVIDNIIKLAGFDNNTDTIGYITKIKKNNTLMKIVHILKTKSPALYIILSSVKIPLKYLKPVKKVGYNITHITLLSYISNSSMFYYIFTHHNYIDDFNFPNETKIVNDLYTVDGVPFDHTIDLLSVIKRRVTSAIILRDYYFFEDF